MAEKIFEKFMFDVRFDEIPPSLLPTEESLQQPTFLQEDLDKARLEGYQQGSQEMQALMREDIQTQSLKALQNIDEKLEPFLKTYQLPLKKIGDSLKEIIEACFNKLMPHFDKTQILSQVEELIQTCLPVLISSPYVIIYVPLPVQEELWKKITSLPFFENYEGSIKILEGPTDKPYECSLQWEDGGASLNLKAVQEKIFQILGTSLSLGSSLIEKTTSSHDQSIEEEKELEQPLE